MLEHLQARQGENIVIELVNGKKIYGKVLSVDQQYVQVETNEGVGLISLHAVYIVWEMSRSLTEENMDQLAGLMRDSLKAQIACTGAEFNCRQQYICRPPDNCTFNFACPGNYVPGFPSGGGGCPLFFCGPFQFQQPCGPFQFGQPCGPFQFQQPCGPFQFQQSCGPFQFGQPCVPFPFQPPCRPFQFQQPCGPFQFQQPCIPFPFGSQCTTPGGFICPGQQFAGIVGPTPGPKTGPGPVPGIKLPPTSMGVNSEVQNSSPEDKEF